MTLDNRTVSTLTKCLFAGVLASTFDILFRVSGLTGDDRFTWNHVVKPAPFNFLIGAFICWAAHHLAHRSEKRGDDRDRIARFASRALLPSVAVLLVLLILQHLPKALGAQIEHLWLLQPVRLWTIFILPVFLVLEAESRSHSQSRPKRS